MRVSAERQYCLHYTCALLSSAAAEPLWLCVGYQLNSNVAFITASASVGSIRKMSRKASDTFGTRATPTSLQSAYTQHSTVQYSSGFVCKQSLDVSTSHEGLSHTANTLCAWLLLLLRQTVLHAGWSGSMRLIKNNSWWHCRCHRQPQHAFHSTPQQHHSQHNTHHSLDLPILQPLPVCLVYLSSRVLRSEGSGHLQGGGLVQTAN
jgi:hypothetical protein